MINEKGHINALKHGDKNSFTILYNHYWKQVYNFCRLYLVTEYAAEEVVQEVFIKLWEIRDSINESENFKGLLFIITRNIIFNNQRKNLNEDFYKMSVLAAMENTYHIEEEIEANNLREYIDRLIEELPPRRKEIFNLSRKENKSYKEIASLLNISQKAVESQITEALKYLRKNICLLLFFL